MKSKQTLKVGDTVKVIKNISVTTHTADQMVGKIGKIVSTNSTVNYPYCVHYGDLEEWFDEKELQLIAPKKEVKKFSTDGEHFYINNQSVCEKEFLEQSKNINEIDKVKDIIESNKLQYPNPYGKYIQVKRYNEILLPKIEKELREMLLAKEPQEDKIVMINTGPQAKPFVPKSYEQEETKHYNGINPDNVLRYGTVKQEDKKECLTCGKGEHWKCDAHESNPSPSLLNDIETIEEIFPVSSKDGLSYYNSKREIVNKINEIITKLNKRI